MAEAFGLQVGDVPEGHTPVDVLCIVKCLKPEAEAEADGFPYQLLIRSTCISNWEAYGMAGWVQDVAFDDRAADG